MRCCWPNTSKFIIYSFTTIILLTWGSADGQNEGSCFTGRKCYFWQFECGTGECISMQRFCDGRQECPDGSDENEIIEFSLPGGNITESTGVSCNNALNHSNKTCILPKPYLCDSIEHCVGNADESYSLCGSKNRYVKHCDFQRCINDQVLECPGCENKLESCKYGSTCTYTGEDENDPCSMSIFRCKSGKCLTAGQFCDGIQDCEDGSDEYLVPPFANATGLMCKNKWNHVDLICYLPPEFLCDGIDHCSDRIDECQNCTEHSFTCDNQICIPKNAPPYRADGVDNCGDSSDECLDNNRVFTCEDGTCLAMEKFCDGVVDCPDGSDEIKDVNDFNKTDVFCQNILVTSTMSVWIPQMNAM